MARGQRFLVFLMLAAGCRTTQQPAARVSTQAQVKGKQGEAAARVEARIAKFKAEAEQEKLRWTPELQARAAALIQASPQTLEEAMPALLRSPHRMPLNPQRDTHRHPAQTLAFFGITPQSVVVEFGAGAGWYTEFLAPLLAKHGKLTVISPDPEGPAGSMPRAYAKRIQWFLDKSPTLYKRVTLRPLRGGKPSLGADSSADIVLAIREMHNWQRRGQLERNIAAVYAVLKPGGVFGVVQHRAAPDADPKASAEKGYLPQKWLVEKVQAAGFRLDATSEINANPKDTKDYTDGVWTLPPVLRKGDQEREKYLAIGESDRMTLRFVKLAGQ